MKAYVLKIGEDYVFSFDGFERTIKKTMTGNICDAMIFHTEEKAAAIATYLNLCDSQIQLKVVGVNVLVKELRK